MKVKLTILSIFTAIGFVSTAQMPSGKFSIDPYVGLPNIGNAYLKLLTDYESQNEFKYLGGIFSYGGRLEYMISDKVGVGADVNYEVSGFQYKYESYAYDSNGVIVYDVNNMPVYENYKREFKSKVLRAMFRVNYHFVQKEKFDIYFGLAGGYRNVKRTLVTTPDDQNYVDDVIVDLLNASVFPISVRGAIGAKMFFTPNIGAHVELGSVGGGAIQFGVFVKF